MTANEMSLCESCTAQVAQVLHAAGLAPFVARLHQATTILRAAEERSAQDSPQVEAGGLNDDAVEPVLLSIEAAAKRLGIGRTTMFALLREGELKTVEIRHRRLIHVAELDRYTSRLGPGNYQSAN